MRTFKAIFRMRPSGRNYNFTELGFFSISGGSIEIITKRRGASPFPPEIFRTTHTVFRKEAPFSPVIQYQFNS
jgi:hypothetical protein